MRDQVARHLERARLAARLTVVGTRHRGRAGGDRARAHHGKDPPRHAASPIDVERRCAGALPRRAAGPRGDGRQPGRQCLQMGAVARRDRGRARAAKPSSGPAVAHRRRRRRPRPVAGRARAGRPSAASGSTRPSPARASAFRSWSSWRGSTAAGSRSARRRSAACAPNWCCRPASKPARCGRTGRAASVVTHHQAEREADSPRPIAAPA